MFSRLQKSASLDSFKNQRYFEEFIDTKIYPLTLNGTLNLEIEL
jgi:hypothetical protein